MGNTKFDGIIFADTWQEFDTCGMPDALSIFFAEREIWDLLSRIPIITFLPEIM